jgi:type II secretory pathway pseudopilin PulG
MAMGVTAVVASAASFTILQVVNTNIRNTNQMTAVRETQSAGYWVNHDGGQAMSDNITADGSTMTLSWLDKANLALTHTCTYTLSDGSLWRNVDGVSSPVAGRISSATFGTTGTGPADTKITFSVTSTVDTRGIRGTETRVYEVAPRARPSR